MDVLIAWQAILTALAIFAKQCRFQFSLAHTIRMANAQRLGAFQNLCNCIP